MNFPPTQVTRANSSYGDASLARLPIFAAAALAALLALLFAACGGGSGLFRQQQTVTNITISDPATCSGTFGPFAHIFITITDVQASPNINAGDNDPSFVDLTPGLKNRPVQVDLLGSTSTQCFLATLATTNAITPANYQQIRVFLADNHAGLFVGNNACGNRAFNCVVLNDGTIAPLLLSSESKTGIKIFNNQISGGGFNVVAGQTKTFDIDFDSCASVIALGNGAFRLKPVVHAGEVVASSAITGNIVNGASGQPLVNADAIVALEQRDSNGVDRVLMETTADTNGNFSFCPVPAGSYDVVVAAVDGNSRAYGPTVVANVQPGITLGDVQLFVQPGLNTLPATLTGVVTTSDTTAPAPADVVVSALQQVTANGTNFKITVPNVLFFNMQPGVTGSVGLNGMSFAPFQQQVASTISLATSPGPACPAGTACAAYRFSVPAAAATVGVLVPTGVAFTQPVTNGPFPYLSEARAFVPSSGGNVDCSQPDVIATFDTTGNRLITAGGAVTTASTLSFTGCQPATAINVPVIP